eukprot:CFRG6500T1
MFSNILVYIFAALLVVVNVTFANSIALYSIMEEVEDSFENGNQYRIHEDDDPLLPFSSDALEPEESSPVLEALPIEDVSTV